MHRDKNMSIGIKKLNHVNVTVPSALEAAAKDFYGVLLGLPQIPKPAGSRQKIGAWYELDGAQIHLSLEDGVNNEASDRHVCYQVEDIEVAQRTFRDAGIEPPSDVHASSDYRKQLAEVVAARAVEQAGRGS